MKILAVSELRLVDLFSSEETLSAVGNGTFHLRPVTPRDEGPTVISLHYEHTPALFNAAKFRMLVRNTVKVLVSKDFDVLWKPDFPLICMNSLCSIALGR